jgi:hypothetical protein
MGGKVDSSINRGNAPFVFRLSGENYHCIGSLLPPDGSEPKFSQLYIYDTDNEVANRQGVLGYVFLYYKLFAQFIFLLFFRIHNHLLSKIFLSDTPRKRPHQLRTQLIFNLYKI